MLPLSEIRAGVPWRLALSRAGHPLPASCSAEWPPAGGRGNWLWLARVRTGKWALDLCDDLGDQTAALAPHFGRIVFGTASPEAAHFVRARMAQDGGQNVVAVVFDSCHQPFRSRTFDCVTSVGPRRPPQHRSTFGEFKRVLQQGACLCILHRDDPGLPHAGLPRSLRAQLAYAASAFFLKAHGFRAVRGYHVSPCCSRPAFLIPRARGSACAIEYLRDDGTLRARLRRAVARLGLHAALYPSWMILAYRNAP